MFSCKKKKKKHTTEIFFNLADTGYMDTYLKLLFYAESWKEMSSLRLKPCFFSAKHGGILLKEIPSDGICQTLFISFTMSLSHHIQVRCSGCHQVSFSIFVNIVFAARIISLYKRLDFRADKNPKATWIKTRFLCLLCHID